MQKIIACIVLLLTARIAAAQQQPPPYIQWERNYGGDCYQPYDYYDAAECIHQTRDGGFIAAGYSSCNGGNVTGHHGSDSFPDYWVVKMDGKGFIQWEKSYGGSGSDFAYSIQQTSDGGYIIAGSSNSIDGDVTGLHIGWDSIYGGNPPRTTDAWIVKIDSLGTIQWERCYGGSGDESANAIEQTSDGGYIVACNSNSNDGDVTNHHGSVIDTIPGNGIEQSYDYWIVKLDMNGNIQWEKCYGGSDVDDASDIEQTPDSSYIVAGTSWSNDGDVTGHHGNSDSVAAYNADYWIVKLSAAGELEWEKSLGGTNEDYACSIVLANDGGYVAAGGSLSTDGDVSGHHPNADSAENNDYDYWVVKLNDTGKIEWEKCYGGSYYDYAWCIAKTFGGGYVVCGESNSGDGDVTPLFNQFDNLLSYAPGYYPLCYWIIAIDSSGTILWNKEAGYLNIHGYANSIQETRDSGFIIAGAALCVDSELSEYDSNYYYDYYYDYWHYGIVKLAYPRSLSYNQFFQMRDVLNCDSTMNDTFFIDNTGTMPLTLASYNFGDNNNWYSIISPPVFPISIATGDSMQCIVQFKPPHWGIYPTELYLWTNDSTTGDNPWQIYIMGSKDTLSFLAEGSNYYTYYYRDWFNWEYYDWWENGYWYYGYPNYDFAIDWQYIDTLQFGTIACNTPSADSILVINATSYPSRFSLSTKSTLFSMQPAANVGGDTAQFIHVNFPAMPPGEYFDSIIIYDSTCGQTETIYAKVIVSNYLWTGISPGDTTICPGDNVTLTANGNFSSCRWSTGATTPQIIVSKAGDYSVTIFDTIGCTGTATTTVNFGSTLSPAITGLSSLCPGDSIILDAGTGFDTYKWSNGDTTENIVVKTPGVYTVHVTQNNCYGDSKPDTIWIYTIPSSNITISGSSIFCPGDSIILQAAAGFDTYKWSNGDTTENIVVKTPGAYTVHVTQNNCYGDSKADTIRTYPAPVPDISPTGTPILCAGDSVQLSAPVGYASYRWSNGDTTRMITVTTPGKYAVTVTTNTSCTVTSDTTIVALYPVPSVTISTSGDIMNANCSITSYKYQWYCNGNPIAGNAANIAMTQPGVYTVVATDVNGCTATASDTIVPYNDALCIETDAFAVVANHSDAAAFTLATGVVLPVDSIVFDLHFLPEAVLPVNIVSPYCAVFRADSAPGLLRVILTNCNTPFPAGALCTAQFLGLTSASDTTRTQICVDNISLYPFIDSIGMTGCCDSILVLPSCGIPAILYNDSSSALSQNYPNPFSSETVIHVTLTKSDAEDATLRVFNILGGRVADLSSELTPNGNITFAAGELSAGVYYYVLQTWGGRWAREMFVVK